MTKVGVGKSEETDSFKAGAEATDLALARAGLERCDFVFVFATVGYEQEKLLKGVRSVSKAASLIGCSSGGIITQGGPDEELKRVGVMVISSDEMKFTPVVAKGLKENSLKAGKEIAEKLNREWPENPKVLIMLPDGIYVNPDSLFKGLGTTLKEPVPFVGGAAGETLAFKKTYQYFNEDVLEDSAPCVLISGDFSFETGVSHGAVATGIEKVVTQAEGNHIYEIDQRPAFNIFKEYLGEEISDLHGVVVSGVCLGVKAPKEVKEKYEDVILRIPLRLDKKDGSLYMAAEWPVGKKILICERNPEKVIGKVREATEKIKAKIGPPGPKFVLQFNCMGRGKGIMGAKTAERELEASQEILGKDVPWLGWYTFGEMAPIGEKNYFHNWTDVLLVIY